MFGIVKSCTEIAILLVSVVFLYGCKVEIPVKEFPSQMTLETYTVSGELLSSKIVGASDPVYQRTKELFEKERAEWEKSYVSYKTGPYILRSKNLIIRYYPDYLVVDFYDDAGAISLRKNISNLLQLVGLLPNQ